MIKWHCNFSIPVSTIQLAEAFIRVTDYRNINSRAEVNILVGDEKGTVEIRRYKKTFQRNFNNLDEIYEELINDYENAEIIQETY